MEVGVFFLKLLKRSWGTWVQVNINIYFWRHKGSSSAKSENYTLFERNPADVYLNQPGLRQRNSAPTKYNMLVYASYCPNLLPLCDKRKHTGFGKHTIYIYKDNWPPLQNILHSWSSHSGKSPRNRHSDQCICFFVSTIWVYSKCGKYGHVDLTFAAL